MIMSNLFKKMNPAKNRLLGFFTTVLMTLMIIFGINLVNRSNFSDNHRFSLFNATQVSADVAEIKYVLHGVDLYGDPLDLPFNDQEITVPKSYKYFDLSFDASKYLEMTFDNGRYTYRGYYTDIEGPSGKYYYRDQHDKVANFEYVYANYPKRLADDGTVNVYIVYEDHQSTKPNKITLTSDAQNKEADKVKRFYTDVNGKQLKEAEVYNNADKPRYDPNFPIEIANYRFAALVMRKQDPNGTFVFSADKLFAGQRADVPMSDITYQHIYPLEVLEYYGSVLSNLNPRSTNTYVYEKFANILTVNYVDENNQPITGQKPVTKQVPFGETYTETAPKILGYTLTTSPTLTGKLDKDATITFKYQKDGVIPPNPGPVNPDPVNPSNPINPDSHNNSDNHVNNNPNNNSGGKTESDHQVVEEPDNDHQTNKNTKKKTVVYAINNIYLYQNKNFQKSQRIFKYVQKPRINRPMFVVLGRSTDDSGKLRLKVKDVNHHSKSAGKVGYITGSWKYVRPVYYQSNHKTLTVINPNGVHAYTNQNLTGKAKHFKQGTRIKVTKFVRHNLTTRYMTSDGLYITGNRKLVINGYVRQPQQIKVKKTLYRYNNANFNHRLSKVKKGTILKVAKYEYSHPDSLKQFGTLRYAVSGGYVTANRQFVKVIK